MNALNKFYGIFFAKENAEPLGLVRILTGICILLTFLLDIPFVADYYSDNGFIPNAAIAMFRDYRFSLLDYVSTTTMVWVAYIILLIATFFLTIGYKTRLASIVTFLMLLSFHERDWLILTSGDSLLRIMAFFLMITNSGAAYSIDALLRKLKGKGEILISKWNRLIIKYQVSLFYFFAAYSKLPGDQWVTGIAVYTALMNPNFARFPMDWLSQFPILISLMTLGTLFIELQVPFLLWFKHTRLIGIAFVVLLQSIIFATMSIGTFQLISIIVVLIFLEKEDIDAFWNWLGKGKKTYTVLYDGSCAFCRKCVQALHYLDVVHRLKYADFRKQAYDKEKLRDMEKQIWLIQPSKKVYKGFYAFRKLAWLIPAFWILAPFLYLPFAGLIGTKIYKYISCKRFQFCNTG